MKNNGIKSIQGNFLKIGILILLFEEFFPLTFWLKRIVNDVYKQDQVCVWAKLQKEPHPCRQKKILEICCVLSQRSFLLSVEGRLGWLSMGPRSAIFPTSQQVRLPAAAKKTVPIKITRQGSGLEDCRQPGDTPCNTCSTSSSYRNISAWWTFGIMRTMSTVSPDIWPIFS